MYQKIQIITLAGICAFAAHLNGAEAETRVSVDVDRPKATVDASVDRESSRTAEAQAQYREEARRENTVKRSNKATGILGMEVRNQQGEKLGEIKDLVMDLKSGKVTYAVLAVGGFLGIGEKLLAVPTSSLASENEGYLLLNADQAQIASAVGFAATNWPEVENPAFDPLLRAETNVGTPARVETQTDRNNPRLKTRSEIERSEAIKSESAANARTRANLDRDLDVEARGDLKVDNDRTKLYTDAGRTTTKSARANVDVDVDRSDKSVEVKSSISVDPKNPNGRLLRGTIRSVDVENRTMVIKTDRGDLQTVQLGDQVQLASTRTGRAPQVVHITDFKPGYPVTIGYMDRNGRMNAYRVESVEAE
ncbi:MAG: PRC-barrel domain-containing protein [Verrucomicrobiales bacterium]